MCVYIFLVTVFPPYTIRWVCVFWYSVVGKKYETTYSFLRNLSISSYYLINLSTYSTVTSITIIIYYYFSGIFPIGQWEYNNIVPWKPPNLVWHNKTLNAICVMDQLYVMITCQYMNCGQCGEFLKRFHIKCSPNICIISILTGFDSRIKKHKMLNELFRAGRKQYIFIY